MGPDGVEARSGNSVDWGSMYIFALNARGDQSLRIGIPQGVKTLARWDLVKGKYRRAAGTMPATIRSHGKGIRIEYTRESNFTVMFKDSNGKVMYEGGSPFFLDRDGRYPASIQLTTVNYQRVTFDGLWVPEGSK